MRILIAPDKFKGSLAAGPAADALAEGFRRVFPAAHCDLVPVADGGEGTAEIFCSTLGGQTIEANCHDALGRPIKAQYTWIPDKKLAVIEMSAASGLWRLTPEERDPLNASTRGTGELMRDAQERGAETILIGLGGSATNDGGAGLAGALGWKFLDDQQNEVPPLPVHFLRMASVQPPPESSSPLNIIALCDVTNPLLGPSGATSVYGGQKGVTPDLAAPAEVALAHLAGLFGDKGRTASETPGSGAAGGLGFGLLIFTHAQIRKGFETIAELLHLKEKIAAATLVVTAEGKLDHQSQQGKAPVEIARLARSHGRPVIVFAGLVEGDQPDFDAAIPIANGPLTLDESRARAAELLSDAAERTARLLKISL